MIVDYNELVRDCEFRSEVYRMQHDSERLVHEKQCATAIKKLLERAEKAEKQRDELFNLLNDVCKDMRETHVDDSVCGLCEYDATHSSENGDCINECPGFDRDDCFCVKKSLREKYGKEEE